MAKKYVPGTVPAHVVAIHGSARKFKATKRRQLRAAQKALDALRGGCAYFPCGSGPVDRAAGALAEIEQSISAEYWGR
jgi:isoaspartyl peptidase/L-asparaginase-like protein (Ntn-hydrolase superfamily)